MIEELLRLLPENAQQSRPAWSEIESRALFDPWLQRAVTLVRIDLLSKEEALIVACLALSAMLTATQKQLFDRIMNEPARTRIGE